MLKSVVLLIGLAMVGIILAACGDDATPTPAPTSTAVPATATPQPTSTAVPATATPQPTSTAVPATATPTARPQPTDTPAAMMPKGKQGGMPPASTNAEIFHFGVHECTGFDNTCLAHPAPQYNGLLEYNPETDDISDIRCDLCTDWDLAEDGVTYTFFLNENARWNNGKPVTATDAAFSLDRMVDPDKPHLKTKSIAPFYESSRAIDQYTLEVKTQFPAPAFFSFLAAEYMKILSKEWVQSVPDEDMKPFENIMGSGPYRLIEAEKSVQMVYVRNEDYFKEGLPYFDGFTLFIIPSEDRLAAAFRTRQVLWTVHPNSGLTNKDALKLAEDLEGQGRVIFVGPIAPLGVTFNIQREPFNDKRVRHAMFLAAHRRPYVQAFSSGVDLLGGPFAPNAWYGIPEDELVKIPGYRETADGSKHPDDIAMARALMDEAGIEEGFKMPMDFAIIFEFPDLAALFADQMKQFLGLDIDLTANEIQTWLQKRRDLQFSIGTWGFGIVAHDPADFFEGIYTVNAPNNYTGWTHPRIEEIAKLQARELDRAKRKALVDEATQIFLTEDSPHIILYHTVRGHYTDLVIQNAHRVGTLSDALKAEHFWCAPNCS